MSNNKSDSACCAPVYLDNNATTPPAPEVLEAMNEVHTQAWGNPSAVHNEGQKSREYLEKARRIFADCLNVAKPSEIVWTSGGTESDCTALWGAYRFAQSQDPKKNKLIISAGEHPAVLKTAESMADQAGINLVCAPLNGDGLPEVDFIKNEIDDTTFLVSIMMANNETGVIYPVEEIGSYCQEKGVLMHTDAVNALSKMKVDVDALPCDFLSFSAHKVNGPKGVGALVWKKPQILPILCGGGQERFRRAGTENVAGIFGFAKAIEHFSTHLDDHLKHIKELRDRLEGRLKSECEPVKILGEKAQRLVNTSTVCCPGVAAQTLLINLDLEGICVSSGSACSSGSLSPSHVLLAMGLSDEEAKTAVRVSLGRFNTGEEIDRAADLMVKTVGKLRGKS